MLDQHGDTIMLGVLLFTIINGGALGVDLEAEKLARDHAFAVQVIIPPCHPRSKTFPPVTATQLAEAIPAIKKAFFRLNKQLESPISLQYIHRNYHVVKNSDMTLVFGCFQATSNTLHRLTGWAVEFTKNAEQVSVRLRYRMQHDVLVPS